ncbi:hypothetical protein Zmor_023426 [Zophobas morio]|uniref:Uncharacterized protein n=1 Tax=Zophobas morio TaxID=2755281 RepID=A0AA38I308_9CUCU|nr:hypothetical protein Zmor_023426 [Zophobas morio]
MANGSRYTHENPKERLPLRSFYHTLESNINGAWKSTQRFQVFFAGKHLEQLGTDEPSPLPLCLVRCGSPKVYGVMAFRWLVPRPYLDGLDTCEINFDLQAF